MIRLDHISESGLLSIDLGTMAESDEDELALLDLVDQAPIAHPKFVEPFELGSLERQRSVLPERRPVKLFQLALDLLLEVVVETLELLDEVMEVEDPHYFREPRFEKYDS